jgi:hypothetical protein
MAGTGGVFKLENSTKPEPVIKEIKIPMSSLNEVFQAYINLMFGRRAPKVKSVKEDGDTITVLFE